MQKKNFVETIEFGEIAIPRWLKYYGKFIHQVKLTIGRPMKDSQSKHIKELEGQLAKKEQSCWFLKNNEIDEYVKS